MDITLVRHGKSLWVENKPITCREFKNWIERYDDHGVFEEDSYPVGTLEKARAANIILTSDLKRAVESARHLNPRLAAIPDSLFRETELPIPSTGLWGLKMKAEMWAVILRCLWFCGYSSGCESLREARTRAEKAAKILVEYAQAHHRAVLVGHGFFNILVGKELKKMGWKEKRKSSNQHWDSATYSFTP